MSTTLTVAGGPSDGRTLFITKPTITIGRRDDNDVVLNGTEVSRAHAVIYRADTGHYLHDLASSNGTFVNDTDIGNARHLLRHGDDIRLGNHKVSLIFQTCDQRATVLMREIESSAGFDASLRKRGAATTAAPVGMTP